MNKYISYSLVTVILFCSFSLGCAKTAQKSLVTDDSQLTNVEFAQSDLSDDLTKVGEEESGSISIRMNGFIGTDQVTMILRDMEDALDEDGDCWAYSGVITYSGSDSRYIVKGYIRKRNLFLDAFDNNGKNIGRFELFGEFFDDVEGYKGTFRNLETGKEYQVKLIDTTAVTE